MGNLTVSQLKELFTTNGSNDGGSPPVLKFTTAGRYKVVVTVYDFMNMTSQDDENQWTIP